MAERIAIYYSCKLCFVMVICFLSAVLSTRDWWNVHINSRVSYLPSFLGEKNNPRITNCKEVYTQFYLLRQNFYVLDIEKVLWVWELCISKCLISNVFTVWWCGASKMFSSQWEWWKMWGRKSFLLHFFLILNLCFPQNIFYKISFPTRYVAEDLPSLACQLFLSARPRSLHTPTEGTIYEGRSGNFLLLAHSRRNQKDTWDCTASQRELLFEPWNLVREGEKTAGSLSHLSRDKATIAGETAAFGRLSRGCKRNGRSQPGACPSPTWIYWGDWRFGIKVLPVDLA